MGAGNPARSTLETIMKSTKGRPRLATDAQVAAIMQWYRTRKTLRQFAHEIGLSRSLVQYVISRRGEYKQCSPELREATREAQRIRRKQLVERGWL
jgi:hypothetical protein